MKSVSGEQQIPLPVLSHEGPSWLAWVEGIASDKSIRQALLTPALHPYLIQHQQDAPAQGKRRSAAKLVRLAALFTAQMLEGCRSASKVRAERGCSKPFCRSNKQYHARLARLSRSTVDSLAIDLATRALTSPGDSAVQPHDEPALGPAYYDALGPRRATSQQRAPGYTRPPFSAAFDAKIQQLLGAARRGGMDTRPSAAAAASAAARRSSLTDVGCSGGGALTGGSAGLTEPLLALPPLVRRSSSTSVASSNGANVVLPAVKSVMSSSLSPSATAAAAGAATAAGTTAAGTTTAASASVPPLMTHHQHHLPVYPPLGLERQEMPRTLRAALSSCDDSGNPAVAVCRLDAQTAPLVSVIGGRLLHNTLQAVLGSADLLSQCFVLETPSNGCRESANAVQNAFSMDLQSALQFVSGIVSNQRIHILQALSRGVAGLDARLKARGGDSSLADSSATEPVARALAIAALILATGGKENAREQIEREALQQRVGRLVLETMFPVDGHDGSNSYQKQLQRQALKHRQGPRQRLGWQARFVRDSRMRQHWLRWWAQVPAAVARQWVKALQATALGNIQQLQGGLTSDRAIALRVAADPLRWAGPLELLRLINAANQTLLRFESRASQRVLSKDADAQQRLALAVPTEHSTAANVLMQREFQDRRIIACFDPRTELLRWIASMRVLFAAPSSSNGGDGLGIDDSIGDDAIDALDSGDACGAADVAEAGSCGRHPDRWAAANIFSPFAYPFLFSFREKTRLLVPEMYERMKQRYLRAHDRQAELVQHQRVLGIDLQAEQVVHPSMYPEWPLLASNAVEVANASSPYLVLAVRRSRLVLDAVDMLAAGVSRLRFPLKVRFVAGGEDGVDMGGVQKELFTQLLPQLLSPERGLFVYTDAAELDAAGAPPGDSYLWPNAASPHSLADFEAVGMLLGVAFANGVALDSAAAHLAPMLVSQLAFSGALQAERAAHAPLSVIMSRMHASFPALVNGLQKLLDWDVSDGGSVEDVFCRSFEITVPDPLRVWHLRRQSAISAAGTDDAPHTLAGPSHITPILSTAPLSPASSAASQAFVGAQQESRGCGGDHSGNASGYTKTLNPPFAHLPLPNAPMGTADDTATFPLVGDGGNIDVTADNREYYVRRYINFITFEYARAQIDALRRGFARAADSVVYRMLSPSELVLWLRGGNGGNGSSGGSGRLDVAELERIADYDDEYTAVHPIVRRFWRVVGGFTQQQLRQLLTFVTASDRVPLGGYENITFVVQRNGPDTNRLPTALTCFGRLLLPAYSSDAKLRERLLTAIENSSGFGLV
ncbi:hypothetical protein GGI07_004274 [Coemansia sp. Benny D115]|nr:hypothetical protein GGI07_004274 [Coemansia sp. Benny D115]